MAPKDAYMGYVAGGGVVSVDTKFLLTMRMLRGASYLDMTWYGVPENHVDTYFLETVTAMNRCRLLDNVKSPSTDAEVEAVMAKCNKFLLAAEDSTSRRAGTGTRFQAGIAGGKFARGCSLSRP